MKTKIEPNKSPAFQFYPKDFLTDAKVIVMNPEVRGLYINLLCIDWLEDGFKEEQMLDLALFKWTDQFGKLRDDDFDSTAMAQLSICFIAHPTKQGYLTSPRLQKERIKQAERREERALAGRRGARARWKDNETANIDENNNHSQANGSAMPEPMAKNAFSSSSSSSSSSSNNIYKGTPTSSEPLFPSNEIKPSLAKPPKDPKPKDPPGFREGTRTFGPYKRVWLTEPEYTELCQKFGTDPVHRKITSLDADLENRVTKYIKFKNHAACLRKWFAMDADKPRRSNYGNDIYTNR